MERAGFPTGWVLLLSALAASSAAFAGQPAGPPPPGLDRLQGFLERVQSMRASFRQEILNGKEEIVERASGHMALKRPGKFRWDYEDPYRRVVVADGERLWLYEADLEQVTVRSLDAGLGETPAALLTGGQEILDRFEFVSASTGEDLAWIRLRPRSTDSDFDAVAIAFSGDRPVQLEIDDRLGQRTRLYLSDIELNPRIGDESFRFDVPKGVDVIREGEL